MLVAVIVCFVFNVVVAFYTPSCSCSVFLPPFVIMFLFVCLFSHFSGCEVVSRGFG